MGILDVPGYSRSQADTRYAKAHSMTGGRGQAATHCASPFGGVNTVANSFINTACTHHAYWAMSDVRLLVSATNLIFETDGPNTVFQKWSLDYGGTRYLFTFGGRSSVAVDPLGYALSDPLAIDIPAGADFVTRGFLSTPWGASTTLASGASAGATSISVTTAPASAFSAMLPQIITVNAELVTVTAVSGTTLTVLALAGTHSSGEAVGQAIVNNTRGLSTNATDGFQFSSVDRTLSGSPTAISGSSTTLAASATAGDTTIRLVNTATLAGTSLVVDTAGPQETVTVTKITGTANPFTAYLSAPLANSHSSGVAVTSAGAGSLIAPIAVLADRTSAPSPILGVGDSIMVGTGYNILTDTSFFTLAFAGLRPFYNTAQSAETLAHYLAANRRRLMFMSAVPVGGWLFDEYSTNDIYGGATLAAVQASKLALWALARSRGLKVATSTITPRTTTTDDWATTGNQTVSNSSANTVRVNYNNWLRAGGITGGPDLVVDLADAVESARDSGLWKAGYAADSTHPNKIGHVAMAAAINPALFV